jgi:hypothetical protein
MNIGTAEPFPKIFSKGFLSQFKRQEDGFEMDYEKL